MANILLALSAVKINLQELNPGTVRESHERGCERAFRLARETFPSETLGALQIKCGAP
jgi:hypothetical protein